jgi:uracil-DNA glycosylase family 4
VPSFAPVREGGPVRLLIVGLAPGLRGANRTGRPFTGDYAGTLLYPALAAVGLARGRYAERADDGFELLGCRVTNAVHCVPPANKPTTGEVATCRQFLAAEIHSLPDLAVILALGTVAHGSVLAALGRTRNAHPFRHGALHDLGSGLMLADSYHCSRYNVNTGRLSRAMFAGVIRKVRRRLDAPVRPRRRQAERGAAR